MFAVSLHGNANVCKVPLTATRRYSTGGEMRLTPHATKLSETAWQFLSCNGLANEYVYSSIQ